MPVASSSTPADAEKELPKLTFKNVVRDIVDGIYAIIFSPSLSSFASILVFLVEAIALKVIIANVNYTEIDFKTYMQQVSIVNKGEVDYSQIYGDTGDLVYPAGHVQIYQVLQFLSDGGQDIRIVQDLFRYLYLCTLLLVLALYFLTIGESNLQPWAIYLLALSKRLHSIYVLRLFNDCFATFTAIGTILILALASFWKSTSSFASYLLTIIAADLFSISISIKMNSLLYLPGFLIVVYLLCDENLLKMLLPLSVAVLVQVLMAFKFLLPLDDSPEALQVRSAYLNQAFNFKRKFLYKWTVNWKFLSEDYFMDDSFHRLLLALHVTVLLLFIVTKIITKNTTGKSFKKFVVDGLKFWKSTLLPTSIINDSTIGPKFVLVIMTMSNLIGVLFSRSLHYQFLSWYAYSLPGLLLLNKYPIIVNILLFLANEFSWNVYPATALSSGVLISVLSVVIAGVWLNNDLFPKKIVVDDDKKLK